MSKKQNKETWTLGKPNGTVITNDRPLRKGESPESEAYYGGHLICESISTKKDAYLIMAAPELLEIAEKMYDFISTRTELNSAIDKATAEKEIDMYRFYQVIQKAKNEEKTK